MTGAGRKARYVGPGFLGRAMQREHGDCEVVEITGRGNWTCLVGRYPSGGVIAGPLEHFQLTEDDLEDQWTLPTYERKK